MNPNQPHRFMAVPQTWPVRLASPAAIEKVVRAYFGIDDWNPRFENYLADYAYKSGELL
jgi:hypothetical protein